MADYAVNRLNMVEGQIKPNRVTNGALIAAFAAVPREVFVPKASRGIAYVDTDIRIAENRWLMKPMVLARLIQEAQLGPADIALDVACGTGYSAAIMARLVETVMAIEGDAELADSAGPIMAQLSVDNVVVLNQDPRHGHAPQQPYDFILIDGAVASVPQVLFDQLAEGGRLAAVLAPDQGTMGQAMLYYRTSGMVSGRALFDAAVPILPGFEAQPAFEF